MPLLEIGDEHSPNAGGLSPSSPVIEFDQMSNSGDVKLSHHEELI